MLLGNYYPILLNLAILILRIRTLLILSFLKKFKTCYERLTSNITYKSNIGLLVSHCIYFINVSIDNIIGDKQIICQLYKYIILFRKDPK